MHFKYFLFSTGIFLISQNCQSKQITTYPSKSFSSSTSDLITCIGFLLRMRAEIPHIRRIANLWNRWYLVCSSVFLSVWLTSYTVSLVISQTASSYQRPCTSTTTRKNLIPYLSQSWKNLVILSPCLLAAALSTYEKSKRRLLCCLVESVPYDVVLEDPLPHHLPTTHVTGLPIISSMMSTEAATDAAV